MARKEEAGKYKLRFSPRENLLGEVGLVARSLVGDVLGGLVHCDGCWCGRRVKEEL
jgi:hypothetical protein